jgi:hypothetical protein
MLPRLELRLSGSYNHILSDNFSYKEYTRDANKSIEKFNKEFQKFKKHSKPFQKAFKKHQKIILQLIQKYSGYSWKGQQIPIYLVNMTQKPSIADPLTLKFREDIDMMLILLIHELTHLNLPEKMQLNAGNKLCEQWVNLVARYVALELKLNLNKASMKNFSEALELGWNLKDKPLIKFLKNDKN